jgi:hypothetical protein
MTFDPGTLLPGRSNMLSVVFGFSPTATNPTAQKTTPILATASSS